VHEITSLHVMFIFGWTKRSHILYMYPGIYCALSDHLDSKSVVHFNRM